MREIIAERLEEGTGAVVGARTVRAESVQCQIAGTESGAAVVEWQTQEGGLASIRVSDDPSDYQRARVYEDDRLLESLQVNRWTVVYTADSDKASAKAASVSTFSSYEHP
jgi:hypothetical protein